MPTAAPTRRSSGCCGHAVDTLKAAVFQGRDDAISDISKFMLAFPAELAPIVGQQTTVTAQTSGASTPRVNLLIARADAEYYNNATDGSVPECDLIVKGVLDDEQRGFLYLRGTNTFQSDDPDETTPWAKSALLAEAALPGNSLTFTCVPPGSGERMG